MIGIFTHTRGRDAPWLFECTSSVREALPPDAEYTVRVMTRDYSIERFEALRSYPYVGFVDDDDRVHPRAIMACAEALETTGAGIAFTIERVVNTDGVELGFSPPARDYFSVAMHPRPLHHFALIRRSAVDDEVLELACKHGVGIDWLMKACAALKHGAVHVPIVGYDWRQHPKQDSIDTAARFNCAQPALREKTLSWMRGNSRIPIHTLQ